MGEASETPASGVQRSLAFVKTRPRSQKIGAAGAAALLATAPFGGLKAVDTSTAAAPLQLDEPFEVGPYEVTLDKVAWTEDLDPIAKPVDQQHRLLLLIGDVRNTAAEAAGTAELRAFFVSGSGVDAVGLDGKVVEDPKVPAEPVLSYPDDTLPSRLSPGVTYRVVWIFQQRKGVSDDKITLNQRAVTHMVDGPLSLDADYYRVETSVARRAALPVETLP